MKTIITAITFTLATTAAQATPINDFCYSLAVFAETAAETRDSGVSRTTAKTILLAESDLGELLGVVLDLVDVVYDNPLDTPAELMVETYQSCIVTLSTSV